MKLCIFPENSASVHPKTAVDGIQKKSNKTQYLYRQLCHIDRELSLLGSSGFPTPHSYSQALHQVQGMKGFLEDQLFTSSCMNQDELTQKKYKMHSVKGFCMCQPIIYKLCVFSLYRVCWSFESHFIVIEESLSSSLMFFLSLSFYLSLFLFFFLTHQFSYDHHRMICLVVLSRTL